MQEYPDKQGADSIGIRSVDSFNRRRAKQLLLLLYVLVPIVCSPSYILNQVTTTDNTTLVYRHACITQKNDNYTGYTILFSPFVTELMLSVLFWYFPLITKMLPCLIVLAVSIRLFIYLRAANRKRRALCVSAPPAIAFQIVQSVNDLTDCGKNNAHQAQHEPLAPNQSLLSDHSTDGPSQVSVHNPIHMSPSLIRTDSIEMRNSLSVTTNLTVMSGTGQGRPRASTASFCADSIRTTSLDSADIGQGTGPLGRATEQIRKLSRLNIRHQDSSTSRKRSTATQATRSSSRKRHYNVTSNLIISVMVLFLLIELPQSLLNFFVAISGVDGMYFYSNIEDIMELLTVLYGSVNFILFCVMNSEFRRVFLDSFRFKIQQVKRVFGCATANDLLTQRPGALSQSQTMDDLSTMKYRR